MTENTNTAAATAASPVPDFPAFPQITREQIVAAITAHDDFDAPEEFAGYEGWDFETTTLQIASALRAADLFGPFRVYMVFEWADGGTDNGFVTVTIPNGPTVCGPSRDLKHLTDDREATGMDGLVAIAEPMIGDAAYAVSGLRGWAADRTR